MNSVMFRVSDTYLPLEENKAYLTEQIITYLGNKRSLLDFIGQGVCRVKKKLGKKSLTTMDLFSGSGIVARYLKQHSSLLMANDLELYSAIINRCYLTNASEISPTHLESQLKFLKQHILENPSPGFISELYAPRDESNITSLDRVFYTKRNALYLDSARQAISLLPENEQHFFLAPLLAKASVHNNTSGVFKGFYKNKEGIGAFGGTGKNALFRILGEIELSLPVFSHFDTDTCIFQEDANTLIHRLDELDLIYLDPPYNQHPYSSNYFMLNLIASYERPEAISQVSGIPTNWNRSDYNRPLEAQKTLFSLIEGCRSKFILLSYNSEGFVSYNDFIEELQKIGTITTLDMKYNAFRASRNLQKRPIHVKEYLFLIERR